MIEDGELRIENGRATDPPASILDLLSSILAYFLPLAP
jgi:hypothetical protein